MNEGEAWCNISKMGFDHFQNDATLPAMPKYEYFSGSWNSLWKLGEDIFWQIGLRRFSEMYFRSFGWSQNWSAWLVNRPKQSSKCAFISSSILTFLSNNPLCFYTKNSQKLFFPQIAPIIQGTLLLTFLPKKVIFFLKIRLHIEHYFDFYAQ